MKEKEIKEKIGELQKQLKKKQRKKVIVDKDNLEGTLYGLILFVVFIIFLDFFIVIPPSTRLSIIGFFVIVLGVPYVLMHIIIKSFLTIKKHKKKK